MRNSSIEWTDNTFNPWIGCTKVSPACKFCYAERMMGMHYKRVTWGPSGTRAKTNTWRDPIKWNRDAAKAGTRTRVFCCSLADVFEDWKGPIKNAEGQTMDDLRRELFDLVDQTPNLDWMLLTKRPQNILRKWHGGHRDNVWLGTTAENQALANRRIPLLFAAKHLGRFAFISAEPLLGPIDLSAFTQLDWVIAGGESGSGARRTNIEWYRSLRDQCATSGIAFHFKQFGEHDANGQRVGKKAAGRILDGKSHDGLPILS